MIKSILCMTFISACMFACELKAAEKTAEAGLKELLPKWKQAWNEVDPNKLYELYHPDGRVRVRCENDPESKKSFVRALKDVTAQFGAIESYTIGEYNKRKDCYEVEIVYATKGKVLGTFAIKSDDKGKYLVFDFDIDG